MENINISFSKPYRKEDGDDTKVQFSAEFKDEIYALKFLSRLNELIAAFVAEEK